MKMIDNPKGGWSGGIVVGGGWRGDGVLYMAAEILYTTDCFSLHYTILSPTENLNSIFFDEKEFKISFCFVNMHIYKYEFKHVY